MILYLKITLVIKTIQKKITYSIYENVWRCSAVAEAFNN